MSDDLTRYHAAVVVRMPHTAAISPSSPLITVSYPQPKSNSPCFFNVFFSIRVYLVLLLGCHSAAHLTHFHPLRALHSLATRTTVKRIPGLYIEDYHMASLVCRLATMHHLCWSTSRTAELYCTCYIVRRWKLCCLPKRSHGTLR